MLANDGIYPIKLEMISILGECGQIHTNTLHIYKTVISFNNNINRQIKCAAEINVLTVTYF